MTKSSKKAGAGRAVGRSRAECVDARKKKLPVLLVTADDELWQQIGPHIGADFAPRQLDSIDELLDTTGSDAAIVLWDARGHAESAAVLSGCSRSARVASSLRSMPLTTRQRGRWRWNIGI